MLSLKQLNKQEQIRVLDHRNACEVLCILLMSAENYAIGNSPDRKFGKYDRYDNVKHKSHLGLKRQLIYEIIVCANSYRSYVEQYHEFNFPKNLSQKLLFSVDLKICIFLICLPVDVGTCTHP